MNYQDINDEYKNLNKRIEDKRVYITRLADSIEYYKNQILVRNGNIASIKLSGMLNDPTTQAKLKINEDEKKKFEEQIKKLKSDLEKAKASIAPLQERVNAEVDKLRNDPDTKRHLDAVVQKRLKRRLNKAEKDKKELTNSKFKVESLQQLIKDHPSIANNIKGMMSANEQVNKLEQELAQINAGGSTNNLARKVEIENTLIPTARAKYEKNKAILQGVLSKVGTIVTVKDVEDIAKGPTKTNKDGSINLDATLNARVNKYRKEIEKIDKKIAKDQISLDLLEAPYRTENVNEPVNNTGDNAQGQENIHWWNFIKRFKAWRERKNTPELPDAKPVSRGEVIIEPEDSKFRDDLKYEIAQDYTRDTMRALNKQSRKIMKDAEKENKDNGAR